MNPYTYFECEGESYPLTHLQPMDVVFIQEAKNGKPEKQYRCVIEFSHHCFTKSPNFHRGEQLADYPSDLYYEAAGETRLFCFEWYEMSRRLPEFLKNMDKEKCFFTTAADKFLTIRVEDKRGVVRIMKFIFR